MGGAASRVAEQPTRVGILGGTFDPIHFGHIKPALELVRLYRLDKVILLPCKLSPFKQKTHVPVKHRWEMLKMVAANVAEFIVDSRELSRDTPSYSYESIKEISAELGESCRLFWIIGADALADFPQWYRAKDIMRLCNVLVLSRPGFEVGDDAWLGEYMVSDVNQFERQYPGAILVTDTQQFEVSSSNIRAMIQSGRQPRYMLPGGVWNYIKRNNLYTNAAEDKHV